VAPAPAERASGPQVGNHTLSELLNAGQLAANEDGQPPAWIDPPARDREPNPPFG
jgi:hypothetical protein